MTDSIKAHKRISIFVDVQNIYYTVRECYQRNFNYRLLWQSLLNEGEIVHAFAYAIDRGDTKQQDFQQALRNIGFEVKLKPYIERQDGTAKGDWDVGIAIDVMDYAPYTDLVVLASGDGDFAPLLQRIKQRHELSVRVVSVANLTAKRLIDCADEFVPIEANMLLNR